MIAGRITLINTQENLQNLYGSKKEGQEGRKEGQEGRKEAQIMHFARVRPLFEGSFRF